MTDIIETLRAVVRDELARQRPPELGIVTEVFARDSDSSDNNHQVSVRLRSSGAQLQHVPVAAPRIGFSLLPRAGDLVMVVFAGGDTNQPVVVGSIYDSVNQPPVGQPVEAVYTPTDESDSSMRRFFLELPSGVTLRIDDDKLELTSGGTIVVVNRDGDVAVTSAARIQFESQGDMVFKAGGNLQLEAQQNFTAKGLACTVEGQAEAKLKGAQVSLAGLTSFSPS